MECLLQPVSVQETHSPEDVLIHKYLLVGHAEEQPSFLGPLFLRDLGVKVLFVMRFLGVFDEIHVVVLDQVWDLDRCIVLLLIAVIGHCEVLVPCGPHLTFFQQ